MQFLKSLPARLLLAIAVGILTGLFLPEGAMTVVLTGYAEKHGICEEKKETADPSDQPDPIG